MIALLVVQNAGVGLEDVVIPVAVCREHAADDHVRAAGLIGADLRRQGAHTVRHDVNVAVGVQLAPLVQQNLLLALVHGGVHCQDTGHFVRAFGPRRTIRRRFRLWRAAVRVSAAGRVSAAAAGRQRQRQRQRQQERPNSSLHTQYLHHSFYTHAANAAKIPAKDFPLQIPIRSQLSRRLSMHGLSGSGPLTASRPPVW